MALHRDESGRGLQTSEKLRPSELGRQAAERDGLQAAECTKRGRPARQRCHQQATAANTAQIGPGLGLAIAAQRLLGSDQLVLEGGKATQAGKQPDQSECERHQRALLGQRRQATEQQHRHDQQHDVQPAIAHQPAAPLRARHDCSASPW